MFEQKLLESFNGIQEILPEAFTEMKDKRYKLFDHLESDEEITIAS